MQQQVVDVCAVNLFQRLALLDDGNTVAITLHDEDGDETADLEMAEFFVTAKIEGVGFLSAPISSFTNSSSKH